MKESDIVNLDKTESVIENKDAVYQREDSEKGFIRNSIEIPLLKASRKYDVVSNMLLGNFDDDGKYIISKQILQELITLKKYVFKNTPDGTVVRGGYKESYFEFLLTKPKINKETQQAICVLYIQEIISKVNGYIQNTLTTPVGTYIYKYDEIYEMNCRKAFNITEQKDGDDGAVKKPTNFIDARFEHLKAVSEASQELYKLLEMNYFNKRVQILNEIPQGTVVLSEFNKKRDQLEKYFLNENKNKYRFLNELLTSILESSPDILAQMPAYKILMGSLNNKYLASIVKISDKINQDPKVMAERQKQAQLSEGKAPITIKEILGNVGKVAIGGSAPKKKGGPAKGKGNDGGGGGGKGGKDGGGGGDKKKDKKADEKKKALAAGTTKIKPNEKANNTDKKEEVKPAPKKTEGQGKTSPKKFHDFKEWNKGSFDSFSQ